MPSDTRRVRKSGDEIRKEVAAMIRREANIAFGMGDPEGAGRLWDIARDVSRVRLTKVLSDAE